ncbi:MAG: 50S ribosomal protein L13 [Nitrospinae bacterium]|nr:50S ribosomal protein L13 [Nitrospinota bacterium]
MKSYLAKKSEVKKKWVVIDAEDQSLGRVAAKAASILRGKTKPIFTPHVDTGDNVIIVNAGKVKLTGNKLEQKVYYRHTGYPGGIKSLTARQVRDSKPEDLLKKAIHGMLPKNRLGRSLHKNVRIYSAGEHPHDSQKPDTVAV